MLMSAARRPERVETDLLRGYNSVTGIKRRYAVRRQCVWVGRGIGVQCGYLEERGLGVDVGTGVVPIVPAAVIFDLGVGDSSIRPTKDDGVCRLSGRQGRRVLNGQGRGWHRGYGRQSVWPKIRNELGNRQQLHRYRRRK